MQLHGGDIYNHNVKLDFSANINPFGMPSAVMAAAKEGVEESAHYPDISCKELKKAIAAKEGVETGFLTCGNGAADVIFSLVLALQPKKALVVWPTFAEYEQALKAVDCELVGVTLHREDGFQVTERILERITPDLDLIFLCNPNNPTGEVIKPELLEKIVMQCKQCGVFLVVDECFQDFLSEEDAYSLVPRTKQEDHLLILKAFTKMYGMAGLRMGYGITGNKELIRRMELVCQPWRVSIPAQKAGIAACKEQEFALKTRDYVQNQRECLVYELTKAGLLVYGSKANYIFFEGPEGLYDFCLSKGVLIRSCASYQGLEGNWYRIAVKREEENQELLSIILPFLFS